MNNVMPAISVRPLMNNDLLINNNSLSKDWAVRKGIEIG